MYGMKLTSIRSMSSIFLPVNFKTLLIAGTGPIPIISGGQPT